MNPGALGLQNNASLYAELDVGDPGSRGRLRQVSAGFLSRGLSFAYQRDNLDNGIHASTYRIGLAGGTASLGAGIAIARYEGATHSTGWDVGASYLLFPGFTLGLVTANIGQPIVRGARLRFTFVPGVTWRPSPIPALAFSSDGRITTDSVVGYAFGVSWHTGDLATRWPLAVIARLDTDGGLRRSAFVFGLSIGSRDRVGVVAATPGDVSQLSAASAYGVSTREAPTGWR